MSSELGSTFGVRGVGAVLGWLSAILLALQLFRVQWGFPFIPLEVKLLAGI